MAANVVLAVPLVAWYGALGTVVAAVAAETVRVVWLHHRVAGVAGRPTARPLARIRALVR